jgi:competence protein ComEC
MQQTILWSVVVGFLLGVFFASFHTVSIMYLACALVASTVFSLLTVAKKTREIGIVSAIACVSFSVGALRMEQGKYIPDNELSPHIGKKITIEGFISAEPDIREGSVRLTVDAAELIIGSSTVPIRARVLVVAPAHTELSYGQEIAAAGKLERPKAFDTGIGRQFDYPKFLEKDGILYELSFAQVKSEGQYRGNPLLGAAIAVKHAFIAGLQNALPEPAAGFAAGITVGDKRSVGSELSATFQKVSLVHVIVLSGYNITVVINALRWTLAFLPRALQYGGIVSAVLFVILMAGGAASATRAGVMALVAVYARASGRQFIATRILGVVALAMVVWNPYTLAFDPSFQLSVLATLGLVLFTPLFTHWFRWIPERAGVREIVASTLGTQTTVLPLLLYQNGNLSIVALPANLLALIAVPAAMFWSVIAALAGVLLGSVAPLFALPALMLLSYIIAVARFFAAMPFASVTVPAFSAWWLVAVYTVLFGFVRYKNRRGSTCGASYTKGVVAPVTSAQRQRESGPVPSSRREPQG